MGQLDHVVVGGIVVSGLLRYEHHPPVGKLVGRAGIGKAKIGGELLGCGIYPPTFQEGKQDDNGNGYDNAEYRDHGEKLR